VPDPVYSKCTYVQFIISLQPGSYTWINAMQYLSTTPLSHLSSHKSSRPNYSSFSVSRHLWWKASRPVPVLYAQSPVGEYVGGWVGLGACSLAREAEILQPVHSPLRFPELNWRSPPHSEGSQGGSVHRPMAYLEGDSAVLLVLQWEPQQQRNLFFLTQLGSPRSLW
jgi:hypothetical protein